MTIPLSPSYPPSPGQSSHHSTTPTKEGHRKPVSIPNKSRATAKTTAIVNNAAGPGSATSIITLGLSAGLPGPSDHHSVASTSTSKYRNRARTSSIDIGSSSAPLVTKRRNSGPIVAEQDQGEAHITTTTQSASSNAKRTRPHRSSTLTTTYSASESRPQLRSRASTNARLPPEARSPVPGSPPSPTTSSSSSSKGRRRAMSSTPRTARQTHPYRNIIIVFSILVSLFLVGTIIVLSSVSYYLAFPDGAFLTEEEVPWTGDDLIASLKEPVPVPEPEAVRLRRRQDWEELDREDAVLDADTIPQVWDELSDEIVPTEDDSAITAPLPPSEADVANDAPIATFSDAFDEGVWGIDGQGSGAYWMREDWDGVVQDSSNWDRLYNVTTRPGEKIPRIIHQTWKTDQLPGKWRKAWKECREGMPDYEYMLWTDDLAHQFMETHYPSFLQMYDSYKYNIQRADSIRYFLLHHFGGIYMDLDIGCRRRMDSLIQGDWEVILPITKPVGISNDLMFSSKGSAFIADTIHGLAAFNHEWFSNYPTVMFSTGPMFLSAQYAIYTSAHPLTDTHQRHEIRVLPKSLYGKNADPATVPHSFFSHFYGSSWHADDAGFIGFLGTSGITVMWIAAVVVAVLVIRLAWQKYHNAGSSSSTQYTLLGEGLPTSSPPNSPGNPFQIESFQSGGDISNAFKRAGNLILTAPATLLSSRGRRRTGLLYFVPAMFQPTNTPNRRRTASEASQLPLSVRHRHDSGSGSETEPHLPPPPYQRESQDWTVDTGNAARIAAAKKLEDASNSIHGDVSSGSVTRSPRPDEQEWESWKETR